MGLLVERMQAQNGTLMDQLLGPFLSFFSLETESEKEKHPGVIKK